MDRFTGPWVQRMLVRARREPLTPDVVLRRMEADIGHGPLAVGRTKNVLSYLDGILSSHPRSPAIRRMRAAAANYLDRERGRLKAA